MADLITINPEPPGNVALDYAALREEAIGIVQKYSGDIWTDYNEHDPGVTILEQFCYALTELSYRAEFPVRDLLTNLINGEIDARKQALYEPQDILPCNPVTTDDYRKLIVDRASGIGNVWFIPDDSNPELQGLYRAALYVPSNVDCVCDEDRGAVTIAQEVTEVYNKHRDVCEDLAGVFLLAPMPIRVQARVGISESASPDITLANIFFQLGLLLAPEIKRSPLPPLMDAGATTEMIFNGPLLLNGLIDDSQLQDKPTCIQVTEISNYILMVPGVINVSDLIVISTADSNQSQQITYSGNDKIPIPVHSYLRLDTSADRRRNDFSISLFIDGVPVAVDPKRVKRELEKLWNNFRRSYNLMLEYAHYFALPHGTYRDLRQYYSIQNQFPNLYGINQYGVTNNNYRSVQPGQAKQLKGYLLVFDQLLANYFSQLAHVKDLYSIDRTLKHTYFFQYLDKSVPDVDPLLKKSGIYGSYYEGLRRIIQSEDNADERRNRFLDVMLAIYGQTLEQVGVSTGEENHISQYARRLIDAKISWLQHLIAGTRDRGRAFDYLDRASGKNVSGMEIKIRIQLGMETEEHTPLSQLCTELGVDIVDTNEEASIGKKLDSYSDYLEGQFSSLTGVGSVEAYSDDVIANSADADKLDFISLSSLHGQRLSEELLHAAADTARFHIGSYNEQQKVALVCKARENESWHYINTYRNAAQARAAATMLAPMLQKLQRNCRQIYLVEHILLRFALLDRDAHDKETSSESFDYSFNLSAVVSATREERGNPSYRRTVYDVIRQNTPAHLLLNVYFFSPYSLCRFERLYWAWRQALKAGDIEQRIISSNRLKIFLQNHHAAVLRDNAGQE
ncbi:MAG: hypothetical protein NVV73_04980 [Cellvibrionaceae bacterium]|nr:hypothetical protein [Cellvibrionaceae bacterium]